MLSDIERIEDLAREIGVMFVNQRYSDLLLEKLQKTLTDESAKVSELENSNKLLYKRLSESEKIREDLANLVREKKLPLSPRTRK